MDNIAQEFVKFSIQAQEKYCQSLFDLYLYFDILGAKSGEAKAPHPTTPHFHSPCNHHKCYQYI